MCQPLLFSEFQFNPTVLGPRLWGVLGGQRLEFSEPVRRQSRGADPQLIRHEPDDRQGPRLAQLPIVRISAKP